MIPAYIDCVRVNHINLVVEDLDASVSRYCDLYGAQYVHELTRQDVRTGLLVIGRVLLQLFAPHQYLLNARYGPHYVGVEYQADVDQARVVIAGRGIRIIRDIGSTVHTHPADCFGIAFEFYGGEFHDAPRPKWREQMKTAAYWRDEHPLGILGLRGYTIAVSDIDTAVDFLRGFLGAEVVNDSERPAVGARAVAVHLGDSMVEVTSPVEDGAVEQHLRRFGDGIRSTVFAVRDIRLVERYFSERGVALHPGDASGALAVAPDENQGVIFEFRE